MPRYTEEQKIRGDTTYSRIKVRGSTVADLNPGAGSNQISFQLPNVSQQFLQCNELVLIGQLEASTSGVHATDQPYVPDAQVILDRMDFRVGGRLLEQDLNPDIQLVQKNLDGSGQLDASINTPTLLQTPDWRYVPQSVVLYNTTPTFVNFEIRIQVKNTCLFGDAVDGEGASTSVLLPTFAMPTCQLDLYFRNPVDVVTFKNAGFTGVPGYTLRNLQLVCSYVKSPSLSAKMAREGFSTSFESFAYQRIPIGVVTAGSKISLQLPSSYSSVNHVLGRFRVDGEYDVDDVDRRKLGSFTVPRLATQNIRLNSKQRYMEDLDRYAGLGELRKIHPRARYSSFVASTILSHAIWGLLCGSDHYDGKHLTGFKSNMAVGGITPELSFEQGTPVGTYADVWISHNRILTISKDGAVTIKY